MKTQKFRFKMNLQTFAGDSLQEMLQKRAGLIQKQRQMLDQAKTAGRDFTEQEESDFDAIESQIKALEKNIEREKALQNRESELDEPVGKTYRPGSDPGSAYGAPTQEEKRNDGGFKSWDEFLHAVVFGDKSGKLQSWKAEYEKDLSMSNPTGAGIMVPPQYSTEILRIDPEASVIRPRATVMPAGSPPDGELNIPVLDQGPNGYYAGVQVTWIAEGAAKPGTEYELEQITLAPKEVAAHTVLTDKLIRNWEAASSFTGNMLRAAMVNAEDVAFIAGNGTGKPLGFQNSAAAIKVNRAVANQISYIDIVKMIASAQADTMGAIGGGYEFIASQSTIPQLLTLKDEGGRYIFIAGDATKGIASTLLGYPIRFTGRTAALGSMGDLNFVNLEYYLIKNGSGPFVEASQHVQFLNNKTVIKAFWNVDGKPWIKAPLTLQDGVSKVSPFIVLDVPAAP